jgi:hypothetical protein
LRVRIGKGDSIGAIETQLLSGINRVSSSLATSIRLIIIRLVSGSERIRVGSIKLAIYTSRLKAIGIIRGIFIVLPIERSISGSLLSESLLSLSSLVALLMLLVSLGTTS